MEKDKIDRFLQFYEFTELSKKEFCEKLDILPQNFSEYLNGKRNLDYLTSQLYSLGCSINWLISGDEPKFANNQAGVKLKIKHEIDKNILNDNYFILNKVKSWILVNYLNFENFAFTFNIDLEELSDTLSSINLLTSDFLTLLNFAGCNTNWVYGIEDWHLNTTKNGIELSNKTIPIDTFKELMSLHFQHLEYKNN